MLAIWERLDILMKKKEFGDTCLEIRIEKYASDISVFMD